MESDIPAIYISPDTAITDAIETQREAINAFNQLVLHPATKDMIDSLATSYAWQFSLDREDLKDFIIEKLRTDLHTVTNPNHRTPSECLHGWLSISTERYCLNKDRHEKVVQRHEDAVTHDHTSCKRNLVPVLRSAVPTPEEELLEKEAEEKRESQTQDIRARVRRVIMSYSPEHVTMAYLWGNKIEAKDIAELLQKPVKTVYGRLEKMQKAVIQEIGFVKTKENRDLLKEGLKQLFASSLQGLS